MLSNFSVANQFCIVFCKDLQEHYLMWSHTNQNCWWLVQVQLGNYWTRFCKFLRFSIYDICICVCDADGFPSTSCGSGLEQKCRYHELGVGENKDSTSSAAPSLSITCNKNTVLPRCRVLGVCTWRWGDRSRQFKVYNALQSTPIRYK